eukprot:6310158-Pyramimonas_sp.AAC.1
MPNPGKVAREAVAASRVRRGLRGTASGLSIGWDNKYGADYGAQENQYIISTLSRAERLSGQNFKPSKTRGSIVSQSTVGLTARGVR